jgi:hypothetical protein
MNAKMAVGITAATLTFNRWARPIAAIASKATMIRKSKTTPGKYVLLG